MGFYYSTNGLGSLPIPRGGVTYVKPAPPRPTPGSPPVGRTTTVRPRPMSGLGLSFSDVQKFGSQILDQGKKTVIDAGKARLDKELGKASNLLTDKITTIGPTVPTIQPVPGGAGNPAEGKGAGSGGAQSTLAQGAAGFKVPWGTIALAAAAFIVVKKFVS